MVHHLDDLWLCAPSLDAPFVQPARTTVLLLVMTPLTLHAVIALARFTLKAWHCFSHEPASLTLLILFPLSLSFGCSVAGFIRVLFDL